jgi:hypothetical protein
VYPQKIVGLQKHIEGGNEKLKIILDIKEKAIVMRSQEIKFLKLKCTQQCVLILNISQSHWQPNPCSMVGRLITLQS